MLWLRVPVACPITHLGDLLVQTSCDRLIALLVGVLTSPVREEPVSAMASSGMPGTSVDANSAQSGRVFMQDKLPVDPVQSHELDSLERTSMCPVESRPDRLVSSSWECPTP
jgi:hypothetical protein